MSFEELKSIALNQFDLDLDNYTSSTKVEISLFKLNYITKSFSLLSGNELDLIIISNHFKDTKQYDNQTILAGYCNMIQINSRLGANEEKLSTDVIFLTDKLLLKKKKFKELIIIHELCHLLDLSDFYVNLDIQFSDEDEKIGNAINRYANNCGDYCHGYNFGKLISYYIGNAYKNNKIKMIEESMKSCFNIDFKLNIN